MILRIKSTDFSVFSGYKYGNEANNDELDKYIALYLNNDELQYFQIECDCGNELSMNQICYISDKLKNCKMFTRTNFSRIGEKTYVLCFAKGAETE